MNDDVYPSSLSLSMILFFANSLSKILFTTNLSLWDETFPNSTDHLSKGLLSVDLGQ